MRALRRSRRAITRRRPWRRRSAAGRTRSWSAEATPPGKPRSFSRSARETVFLVVRGDSLYKSMSSYLAGASRISENIEVLLNTRCRRMSATSRLRAAEIVNDETGETRTIQTVRPLQLHRCRLLGPIGCQTKSRKTRRASFSTGIESAVASVVVAAATRFCSRRPARAFSLVAMCGLAR